MGKKLVIDAHCHLFQSFDAFPAVLVDDLKKWMSEEWLANVSTSGTVVECIKTMDEAGIDKSVVCIWDAGIMCNQEPKISIWEQNEYVADAQKRYPDRLIGLIGVDPLRKDAVEIVEKGITKLGLKGVKVYCSSCKVTDPRLQPFMELLNDLGLPVLFHAGSDPLPFQIQYGDPRDLDVLTARYPKIKIQVGHCARGYGDTLNEAIHFRENIIYQDISGWQDRYQRSQWQTVLYLRFLMDFIPGSVLMGTDWPWERIPPKPSAKEWFDFIRNMKIPKAVLDLGLGIKDFTQEEKDMILGENAMRLYGIK